LSLKYDFVSYLSIKLIEKENEDFTYINYSKHSNISPKFWWKMDYGIRKFWIYKDSELWRNNQLFSSICRRVWWYWNAPVWS